ncbi:MAG TPA: DUF5615 family PIN-like protein [Thermoanaerobaculia bacterium]|nr:DUF5615 family PIN-like protein [Thermoanaerobaculia bacterium]
MKLLIDMNLSPEWVDFLRESGFEAQHWASVGNPRASDPEILGWARAGNYIVVTHDLDFSRLLALTRACGPSVLQIRTQDVLPGAMGKWVLAALEQYRQPLEAGALVVVDTATSRARILPVIP